MAGRPLLCYRAALSRNHPWQVIRTHVTI